MTTFTEKVLECDKPTISRVSHEIVDLRLDGSALFADIKFLDIPMGRTMKNLMKQGGLQFSTCGTGKIDDNGVVSEFQLLQISVGSAYIPDKKQEPVVDYLDVVRSVVKDESN